MHCFLTFEVKYLGVILDNCLISGRHAAFPGDCTRQMLARFYVFVNWRNKFDPGCKIKFHKYVIRPLMLCASG